MMTMAFGENKFIPTIRMLSDLKKVVYDKEWIKTAKDVEVYFMFRNLYLNSEHKKMIERSGIQYDITIIPPHRFGSEFPKTNGHYHSAVPQTDITYPELYEVLEGEAHYMLQKEDNGELTDVVMIRALPGDKVVVPPNYGHITINASNRTLIMANWVCTGSLSDYGRINARKGGAYFMLVNGILVPNKNYGSIPPLRCIQPSDLSQFEIEKSKDIYNLIEKPRALKFLVRPEKSSKLFSLAL
jgi:glucose-6-phosphate isomerase